MKEKPLYSIARVQSILKKYGLDADKRFGQNFLVDANVLTKIVSVAEIDKNDLVVEIGPGLGVLSYELAKRAAFLKMIELDKRLLEVLRENLAEFANFEIVNQDALEYDYGQLPQKSLLVANLPYNVATPLIVKALESGRFKKLVFLVQKEVAQRLSGAAKGKAHGALSLIIEHFGQAKRIADVNPNSFFPPPKVTSSIVRIDVNPSARAEPRLFEFIHRSFNHRRKTLKKNLIMAGHPADEVLQAINDLKLKPAVRAEELSLRDFKLLNKRLLRSD